MFFCFSLTTVEKCFVVKGEFHMQIMLIVILIIAAAFFIWQLVLFIKDLIKFVKKKQADKNQNRSDEKDADRKE